MATIPEAAPLRGPCNVPVTMTEETFARLLAIANAQGIDFFGWLEERVEALINAAYDELVSTHAP